MTGKAPFCPPRLQKIGPAGSGGYLHRLAARPVLPQFAQPFGHEFAHGMGCGVEDHGDVVVFHFIDEPQQQGFALLGRKLV